MALYLVQHGKSLSKEVDPQKGLSEQGSAEVKRIADAAKGYNVQVGSICHSGKTRARQTAEIFASALEPQQGIREKSDDEETSYHDRRDGHKPPVSPIPFACPEGTPQEAYFF